MTVFKDFGQIVRDALETGTEIYLGKKQLEANAAAAAFQTPQGTNAVNIDGAPVNSSSENEVIDGVSNRSLLIGGGVILFAAFAVTGFALAGD